MKKRFVIALAFGWCIVADAQNQIIQSALRLGPPPKEKLEEYVG